MLIWANAPTDLNAKTGFLDVSAETYEKLIACGAGQRTQAGCNTFKKQSKTKVDLIPDAPLAASMTAEESKPKKKSTKKKAEPDCGKE